MDHHLIQARQRRLEPLENPPGEHLAGRVFQALDVIEVTVIKLVVERSESRLDVGEVHNPTQGGVRLATDVDFHAERMTVQTRALVARRHVRQAMGGLDREDFEDMHQ